MKYFGIDYDWVGNTITIKKGNYQSREYVVEADWSGASYWYEMAAFADELELKINGLSENSLQGDSIASEIFEMFGIKTTFSGNGVCLKKEGAASKKFEYDFANYPDLVQTFATTCVIKNIPFRITGAESLKIKETNRIKALHDELAKFGANIAETSHGVIEWDGKSSLAQSPNPIIKTYVDHRMALAFAPIAISKGEISIDDPGVVAKSYPNYWDDLKKVGFEISEIK